MTRIPLTLFGLLAVGNAARADVAGPFDPFLHRVRIQHIVVLEQEIPGFSYLLLHPGGHTEWLELQPRQQIEVSAWSNRRRSATVLYAVPQAGLDRAGSKDALIRSTENDPQLLGGCRFLALTGGEQVGPADTRSEVIETITIRRGADGVPTFDVESKTVARVWLCPLAGLCLSALAVWLGWRWFGRKREPQAP